MNAAHRIADSFRSVIGYWTPKPTVSQFIEKGTLTPAEFIQAGDQLAFKFPTWKWQGVEGRRQVSWLPPDKQYLITFGVSCRARVRDLDACIEKSSSVSTLEGEVPWLVPFFPHEECIVAGTADTTTASEPLIPPTVDFKDPPRQQPTASLEEYKRIPTGIPTISATADSVDERVDDQANINDLVDEPDDVCVLPDNSERGKTAVAFFSNHSFVASVADIYVTHTRSYDLSITYDKYYQTPRLWLKGYDEQGLPLESKQIFEDILTDYVSKTVTIDPHPCTGELTVSIHPCKHAAMMKRVVNGWLSNNIEPRPDLALIVLLKFISSVIPTIQYDTTLDIPGFFQRPPSEKSASTAVKATL